MVNRKSSPIPLYYQIKEEIKEKIKNKEYKVGEKIPSETNLMLEYNASRMTIRNAVSYLENEGFVEKSQGVGTYVRSPKATQQFNQITSWTETMNALGREVSSELIKAEVLDANEYVAGFGINVGTPLYLIERARYCEGEPMAYVRNYIVKSIAPGLLNAISSAKSLYSLMEENYDIIYSSAKERVGARGAQTEEAKILNIKKGTPVMTNTRIVYNEQEEPFELDISVIRADKYEIAFTMKGRPQKL